MMTNFTDVRAGNVSSAMCAMGNVDQSGNRVSNRPEPAYHGMDPSEESVFMPAFLVPVDDNQSLIPLEKAIVLIGRQSDCDVSLTKSRKISRKHCCIAQVNDSLIIRDLGSTNGIFLNGNRIAKEALLTLGDEITIGDIQFTLRNELPAAIKGNGARNTKGNDNQGAGKSSGNARSVPPVPPTLSTASRKPLLIPSSAELQLKFDEESSGDLPISPRPRS